MRMAQLRHMEGRNGMWYGCPKCAREFAGLVEACRHLEVDHGRLAVGVYGDREPDTDENLGIEPRNMRHG